jgi:hypothetical protein
VNFAFAYLLIANLAGALDVVGVVAAAPTETRPADPRPSEPRKDPASNPIWGCWQNVEKPTMMLRFEPARRTLADKDLFAVATVNRYGTDYVIVKGSERRVAFSLKGNTLTLTDEKGQKGVFRRMAGRGGTGEAR